MTENSDNQLPPEPGLEEDTVGNLIASAPVGVVIGVVALGETVAKAVATEVGAFVVEKILSMDSDQDSGSSASAGAEGSKEAEEGGQFNMEQDVANQSGQFNMEQDVANQKGGSDEGGDTRRDGGE